MSELATACGCKGLVVLYARPDDVKRGRAFSTHGTPEEFLGMVAKIWEEEQEEEGDVFNVRRRPLPTSNAPHAPLFAVAAAADDSPLDTTPPPQHHNHN